MRNLFLMILCLFFFQCNFSNEKSTAEENRNYVIGYIFLGRNTPTDIRWHTLTHLNVAFLYANDDGTLSDSRISNSLKEIVDNAHRNNVKVIVSLRDDTEQQLSKALINNRSILVDNLIRYAKENKLDGIDFDFEGWRSEGIVPHVLAFAKEFHQKKPDNLLFTCAVNMFDRGYTTEWHTWFDVINVMTYDVHGPWNNEGQHAPYEESLAAITDFWMTKMGAPASKLTLGLPFYGYSWNEGDRAGQAYTYEQILAKYPDMDVPNKDQIEHLYYNGKSTIKRKTQWAKEHIAGIMIWQIGGDAKSNEESLLEAIAEIMQKSFIKLILIIYETFIFIFKFSLFFTGFFRANKKD